MLLSTLSTLANHMLQPSRQCLGKFSSWGCIVWHTTEYEGHLVYNSGQGLIAANSECLDKVSSGIRGEITDKDTNHPPVDLPAMDD